MTDFTERARQIAIQLGADIIGDPYNYMQGCSYNRAIERTEDAIAQFAADVRREALSEAIGECVKHHAALKETGVAKPACLTTCKRLEMNIGSLPGATKSTRTCGSP